MKRGAAAVAILLMTLATTPASARGFIPPARSVAPVRLPIRAQMTLVGGDSGSLVPLTAVVTELLLRQQFEVDWRHTSALAAQDVLDQPGTASSGTGVWIDPRAPTQGLLYFRDESARRFIIRRLPFDGALDAVAIEALGQVVESAMAALRDGAPGTLTRSEAVVALATMPSPPSVVIVSETKPTRARSIELSCSGAASAFSSEIPVAERLEVSAAVMSRAQDEGGRSLGAWGAALSVGYAWPTSYDTALIGVEIRTMGARATALRELELVRGLSLRLSVGGGVDRVRYVPRRGSAAVDLASGGAFFVPLARGGAAIVAGPWRRLWVFAGAVVEVALSSVHFDVVDGSGGATRVVVPFAAHPGFAMGVEARF